MSWKLRSVSDFDLRAFLSSSSPPPSRLTLGLQPTVPLLWPGLQNVFKNVQKCLQNVYKMSNVLKNVRFF